MNYKTLAALAALALVSACAKQADTTGAAAGNGALASTSGAVPGSQEDSGGKRRRPRVLRL